MAEKPNSRKDEIELAKSIFDDIVAETESEGWEKESRADKKLTRETKKDLKQKHTTKEAA